VQAHAKEPYAQKSGVFHSCSEKRALLMTGAWLLADNKNKCLIAQVVAIVMQFDTASQNKY
jgi:hypothetical protein